MHTAHRHLKILSVRRFGQRVLADVYCTYIFCYTLNPPCQKHTDECLANTSRCRDYKCSPARANSRKYSRLTRAPQIETKVTHAGDVDFARRQGNCVEHGVGGGTRRNENFAELLTQRQHTGADGLRHTQPLRLGNLSGGCVLRSGSNTAQRNIYAAARFGFRSFKQFYYFAVRRTDMEVLSLCRRCSTYVHIIGAMLQMLHYCVNAFEYKTHTHTTKTYIGE